MATCSEKLTIEFEGAQGLLCARSVRLCRTGTREFPSGFVAIDRPPMANDAITNKKEAHRPAQRRQASTDLNALILTPDGKRHHQWFRATIQPYPETISNTAACRCDGTRTICSVRMPDARGHNASRFWGPGRFHQYSARSGMERTREMIARVFRKPHDNCPENRQGRNWVLLTMPTWNGTPARRGYTCPTRINHVIKWQRSRMARKRDG